MLGVNRRRTSTYCLFPILLATACSQQPAEVKSTGSVVNPEPKPAEVATEHSQEITAWSARLVQRAHGPEASDAVVVDVSIVDATGNKRLLAKDLIGPLLLFETERKIFSCEFTGALVGDRPIIFDLNGQRLEAPAHPGFLRNCSKIEDSGLALLHYNLVRNSAPYNLVRVVDTSGQVVFEKELTSAGDIEVKADRKSYQVHVPEPELPG